MTLCEVDHHELEAVAGGAGTDQPRAPGECRGQAGELDDHSADGFLEDLRGAIHAKHAIDQDADPVSDPFDVREDVRAEEDTTPLAADELDHRHQEVAADDRIKAKRGIVEDQQVGVGRDRERAVATAARWPCESRRIFLREGSSKWSRIFSRMGPFQVRGWKARLKRTASATVIQP